MNLTKEHNISKLKVIILPLYVRCKFKGQISPNPWKPVAGNYTATSIIETEWANRLNYHDLPVISGTEEIIGNWDYLDYETIYCTMKCYVNVYYEYIPVEDGKDYYIIYENGNVITLESDGIQTGHNQLSRSPNTIYTGKEIKDSIPLLVIPIA